MKKMKAVTKKFTRDNITWFTGLVLVINEAARNGLERPSLLILYGGMIGLPSFRNRDEKGKEEKEHEHKPTRTQRRAPDQDGAEGSAG